MPKPNLAPDQNRDRAAWLEWRAKRIGGSDAPVILGLVPWKDRVELYHEKRHGRAIEPDNADRLAYFLMLEEVAVARWCKQAGLDPKRVQRRRPQTHPEHERIACTVDRVILKDPRGLGIAEVKTASPVYFQQLKLDGPSDAMLVQTIHNCAVFQAAFGTVVILNRDSGEVLPYEFRFDGDAWADILTAELDFIRCVEDGTPPPVEAPQVELPSVCGELVRLAEADDPALVAAINDHHNACKVYKEAEALKARTKRELLTALSDRKLGAVQVGLVRARLVDHQSPDRLDVKSLRIAHPDIAEEFTRPGRLTRYPRTFDVAPPKDATTDEEVA